MARDNITLVPGGYYYKNSITGEWEFHDNKKKEKDMITFKGTKFYYTKEPEYLKKIKDYCEDDVKATKELKDAAKEVNYYNTAMRAYRYNPNGEVKSINQVVTEVIDGKWDYGLRRNKLLTAAGFDYEEIQNKVNERILEIKQQKLMMNSFYGLASAYGVINTVYQDPFAIDKVIYNGPATIVFWHDGTKTIVKCYDEVFDPEKGLAMAISKKALGNKGSYYETFKKHLPEVCEEEDDECIAKTIKTAFDKFRNLDKKNDD